MTNFMKNVFIILLVPVLYGCSTSGYDRNGSVSRESQAKTNFMALSKKLPRYNVDVYRADNSVYLLLPSRHFFTVRSANFTKNAYEALQVILLLSDCCKTASSVTVTAYYNNIGGSRFDRALAVERARRVVEYLWQAGIDTTFIYADGKNISFNCKKRFSADRILIKLAYDE